MAQFLVEKPLIASKESGSALLEQKTSKAIVLYAFLADISANQEGSDTPTAQQLVLTLWDVLIQDDHRARRVSGRAEDIVVDVLKKCSGCQL